MPQLWGVTRECSTALCALFLPRRETVENSQMIIEEQFTYLWEEGDAEPEACFRSLEGKKNPNPPSTTHSDCSVQCCDQNASVHKACGKAAMPMDHEWTPDHKQVISTLQESRNPFFFFLSPNQIMHNKGPQDGPSWIAENRQKPQSMRQTQNESGANLFLILLLFTAAYSSFKYHSFLFLGWDTVRLVWAQS